MLLVAAGIGAVANDAHADEIEATVYAARKRPLAATSSPGEPDIKRNIVGGGVEYVDAPPADANGWVLRVGVAVEHQADCAWASPSCPFPSSGGPRTVDLPAGTAHLAADHVEAGAHARVGYVWRVLQVEGGVLVYSTKVPGTQSQEAEG
jgi:hypothetical protein